MVLVLQRCETSLRQWLGQQTDPPGQGWVSKALKKFIEVASLIEQLHARHIAHCDVKLDNVLLLDGACLLSDFGQASMFALAEKGLLFESR